MTTNPKKEIQEQRMKGYFLQAAREMVKGEGLKSVSVRSVSDRAGYSYATMYNYFKDINELVFYCVKDFQEECEAFIREETSRSHRGIPRVKAIMKAFINYFVQYPGIFELFYLEKLTERPERQSTSTLIATFVDRLCREEWEIAVSQKKIPASRAEVLQETLRSWVAGILILYLNRRFPGDYKEFIRSSVRQLDQVMNLNP